MVVRVKCVVELVEGRRPGNKPGGYPAVKSAPVIKCVPKGVFRNFENVNQVKSRGKLFSQSALFKS